MDRKSGTEEYNVWRYIRQICYNKKHSVYDKYGGLNVTVCDKWKDSFEAFYKDVGPKPSKDHVFTRNENSGNYEPGNCGWVLRVVNANNNDVRKAFYEYNGEQMTLPQISKKVGIKYSALYYKVVSCGLSVNEALSKFS